MRILCCLLLPVIFCRAQPQELLKEWNNDPQLKGASVSFCVMDASTGKVLAEHQPELSLIPASTLKIFTTGAALGLLGDDFRYTTRLACTGVFDTVNGTLKGDLLIIGNGDPTLGSAYFGKADVVTEWAEVLYKKGLRHITGNVTGYAGDWERTVPDHWIWADISNYYGAVPCGLSYRDNKFSIIFSSGKSGSKAEILSVEPRYKKNELSLNSSVVCEGTSDQAYVYGDPFSQNKSIRGSIPANRSRYSIDAALPDPALLCAEELLEAMIRKGIKCDGKTQSEYTKNDAPYSTLHTHSSPVLSQIIKQTNLHSNNHYCESLVLTLGRGNREAGLSAVREYWRGLGLPAEGLFLSDGSGLSRASTCNTRLQADALCRIFADSSLYAAVNPSLPAAGRQGSMRSVGRGTFLEDNLRAKTGYIQRVRSYCGYLKNRKGKLLAFSVIMNNYNCSPSEARIKLEKFMLSLADL